MESTPFLYFPVKYPINLQNLFGANPAEYKPLGQAGHPGNDFECPYGTPVYAPCDGAAFYSYDSLGGDGIYIRTPDTQAPTHNIILWHMVPPGDPQYPFQISTKLGTVTDVKAGQLLGYSGNSGFPRESTGPHLHLGVMPINAQETASFPNNGEMGCIDPQPFFNGHYAEDIGKIEAVVTPATSVVQNIAAAPDATPAQKLTWIPEVAQAIEGLIKKVV